MRPKLSRTELIARNRLDRQIDEVVRRRCSGVPISIMDIGKVFEAGYRASQEGRDLEAAVVSAYNVLAA